ncbi:MAG: hypothetical protein ACP5G0_09275 [Desulfomonilia bacterium]
MNRDHGRKQFGYTFENLFTNVMVVFQTRKTYRYSSPLTRVLRSVLPIQQRAQRAIVRAVGR